MIDAVNAAVVHLSSKGYRVFPSGNKSPSVVLGGESLETAAIYSGWNDGGKNQITLDAFDGSEGGEILPEAEQEHIRTLWQIIRKKDVEIMESTKPEETVLKKLKDTQWNGLD